MKNIFYIILVVICGLSSCKKATDRTCWKGSGEPATKIVQLDDFSRIVVKEKIELTLIQDTANYLEIEGFANMNDLIQTEIKEGELTIKNENKCDFLRNYSKKGIAMKLHFKDIDFIDFHGTEPLFTQGVITTDRLEFQCIDGAGTVQLHVNVHEFNAVQGNGFGNYIVTGTCHQSNQILANNGFCDALGLTVTGSLAVVNRSQAHGKFNVSGTQEVRLQTTAGGDIMYRGEAVDLQKSELGTGKIYQIN